MSSFCVLIFQYILFIDLSNDILVCRAIFIPKPIFAAGNVSFRSSEDGSHFIKSCATIFENDYSTRHLEQMMLDVRADIGRKPEGKEICIDGKWVAQIPEIRSTLTREFYLKRYSAKLENEDDDN